MDQGTIAQGSEASGVGAAVILESKLHPPVLHPEHISRPWLFRRLASDLTRREIAGDLYLSVNTIKAHTRSIYAKPDAGSRLEAVARARSLHLIA